MHLSLDEVHDHIDGWIIDPAVETLAPAEELLASMSVGDPGRVDVLEVIADHQALRGDLDAAHATIAEAAADPRADADLIDAARVSYWIQAGRGEDAELLRELRRRMAELPAEAIERVGDALEDSGRLQEAMRWYTIALRDLDPLVDVPDVDEEYAVSGRWRVRKALELPADRYDELARVMLDERRARARLDWT